MAGKDMIAQGVQRRREIAEFIAAYSEEHGYSPTMSEIGEAVGIVSPNAIRGHLLRMQRDGVIEMTPRTARSIQLLEQPVGG